MASQYRVRIDSLLPTGELSEKELSRIISISDLTPNLQSILWAMKTMSDVMEEKYQVSSNLLKASIANLCGVRIGKNRRSRTEAVEMITQTRFPPEPTPEPKKKSWVEKLFG